MTRDILCYLGYLICIALLFGCSRQASGHAFEVVVGNEMTIALTSGGPKYTEFLFTLDIVLVLNEVPSQEESLLNRPAAFVRRANLYSYVADNGNHRVATFDDNGKFESAFGRSGQGPGDIGGIGYLSFVNDELHVYDARNYRVSRFNPDGTFIGMTSAPLGTAGGIAGYLYRMHLMDDGRVVLIMQEDRYQSSLLYERQSGYLIDAVGDTVLSVRTAWQQTTILASSGDGSRVSFSMPFAAGPQVIFDPHHGFISSGGDVPELTIIGLDGSRRSIRIEEEPRPITAEDRSAFVRRIQDRILTAPESQQVTLRTMKSAVVFPEYRAFWDDVSVDDHGYFWLRMYETSAERYESGGGHLYRLLSPTGEYLGDIRIPPFVGLKNFANEHLLIIRSIPDSDETPLTIYRMHPAITSFKYP